MKKLVTCLLIVAISLSSIGWGANDVYAHPGRTDANGGHCVGGKARDGSCPSGDYHYHGGTTRTKKGDSNYWVVAGVILGTVVILYYLGSAKSKKYWVETVEDEFKPFEPYATFDFDTQDFETGLRYKHNF